MATGEQKLWNNIGPKLRRYGHFERIESHETALGMPDVDYCIGGYSNKLELKYTASEKKGFRLRPAQAGWFKKRVRAKGQPWLLAMAEIRKTKGFILIAATDVPRLVYTTKVEDWFNAGVIVWEKIIVIDQLVQFLGTYLIAEPNQKSGMTQPEESSRLILPSHLRGQK